MECYNHHHVTILAKMSRNNALTVIPAWVFQGAWQEAAAAAAAAELVGVWAAVKRTMVPMCWTTLQPSPMRRTWVWRLSERSPMLHSCRHGLLHPTATLHLRHPRTASPGRGAYPRRPARASSPCWPTSTLTNTRTRPTTETHCTPACQCWRTSRMGRWTV